MSTKAFNNQQRKQYVIENGVCEENNEVVVFGFRGEDGCAVEYNK